MRILHFEDDVFKHSNICKALERCGKMKIDLALNLREGIEKLESAIQEGKPYDLIITDMYYPEHKMDWRKEVKSGNLLIQRLKDMNITTPVILCSTVNYKHPEIYGSVHYSEINDWENELAGLVGKLAAGRKGSSGGCV